MEPASVYHSFEEFHCKRYHLLWKMLSSLLIGFRVRFSFSFYSVMNLPLSYLVLVKRVLATVTGTALSLVLVE